MSNNLKTLEATIEAQIDPNGIPGSILALNHQNILKDVLNNVGKAVGFHFTAEKDPSPIPTGKLSFNGNAFNNIAEFLITVSELSLDLNDFGNILNLYAAGTTIHFKDYVGRSAMFEFVSFVAADDGMGNNTYEITVKGFADNTNYTYQDAESEPATLSMYQSTIAKIKAINFGTATYNGDDLEVALQINALADLMDDYKTVQPNQIVMFHGIIATKKNNKSFADAVYVVPDEVAGIYGVGGNIVLTDAELLSVENGGTSNVPDPGVDDPNAFVHDLGEIPDGDYLTVINAEPAPFFVIVAGTNWYFTLTVGGLLVILAHDGANGTYGLAQDQMILSELLIIYDERVPVGFPYDLTGIVDKDILVWNAANEQFEPAKEGTDDNRRRAVIDIVDNTVAPPTEVLGDRYILDFTGGGVHADWDGLNTGDIAEFDGADWIGETPVEGWVTYVDLQDLDALYVDDGTPAWELRETDVANAITNATTETTIPDTGLLTFVDTTLKHITWANVKIVLQTFFDTIYEKLLGTVADGNIDTAFVLNHDNKYFGVKTMTGDTTFSDSNLVVDGVTRGIYLTNTGNFLPTFPAYWNLDFDSDTYADDKINRITWDVLDATPASEDVRYYIKVIT